MVLQSFCIYHIENIINLPSKDTEKQKQLFSKAKSFRVQVKGLAILRKKL